MKDSLRPNPTPTEKILDILVESGLITESQRENFEEGTLWIESDRSFPRLRFKVDPEQEDDSNEED